MMRNSRQDKNGGKNGAPLPAALELLARRALTARETQDKLRERGFGAEETEETLRRLSDWGYIDDDAYARRYCRLKRERRSLRRIRLEIRRRGVEDDLVAAALAEEYPPEQEQINCLRLLHQKGAPAALKTAAALSRQGYAESHIRQALESFAREAAANPEPHWDN
ncbi:MAG: RecX family transcriptional regulator [Gracilibacteraceae bacterium]|jgi:SOS response regulatory protein OraA/RecX|nr:RecX family transcriptional regulator [Gracilibacteraceae bacterium]